MARMLRAQLRGVVTPARISKPSIYPPRASKRQFGKLGFSRALTADQCIRAATPRGFSVHRHQLAPGVQPERLGRLSGRHAWKH